MGEGRNALGSMEISKFWKDRNVFVTGATGVLGSWLTQYLVGQKANVTILLRDTVPMSQLYISGTINKVNVARGSLERFEDAERSLNEYEIDTCFHLGAQTIVTTANRSPISTFESNIKGTWNLLEAARKSELIERFVFASSDKSYGEHEELPYTEETPLRGSNPYDVSKSCSDLIAQTYYNTYKMPIAIARLGNIYGGGDLNFNRIVPGTIKSLLSGQSPVIRSDGTYRRDYLYVKDAVEAYVLLCEKLEQKNVVGNAFNFSTNDNLTVLDIVNRITTLMKKTKIRPKILGTTKGEIKNQSLSWKKAGQILNWKPKYRLEQGLKETIEWYTSFLNK